MRNLKLTFEYDGTNYHGWQKQPGLLTIQGILEACLAKLTGDLVHIKAAGRTDAGVHAFNQIANFKSRLLLPEAIVQRALNRMLPEDIVVKRVEEVPLDFDARRHAKSKTYRYTLLIRPYRSPLERLYSLFIPFPLNVEAMAEAASYLVGEHDFSSFRATGGGRTHPVRHVMDAHFVQEGERLFFFITADAFLKHMVRIIVGTLLEVGKGNLRPKDFKAILEARDRKQAGKTIAAKGLCLMEVNYESRQPSVISFQQESGLSHEVQGLRLGA